MAKKCGEYSCEVYKKGKNEMSGQKLKDGEIFYIVWTGGGEGFDTTNLEVAIMMSAQIRIENKLNKILRKLK